MFYVEMLINSTWNTFVSIFWLWNCCKPKAELRVLNSTYIFLFHTNVSLQYVILWRKWSICVQIWFSFKIEWPSLSKIAYNYTENRYCLLHSDPILNFHINEKINKNIRKLERKCIHSVFFFFSSSEDFN